MLELDQAKTIIRSLADGRDPATGEQFPPSSPYQQADTVRALFTALEALEGPSNKPEADMPRRSGEAAKAGGPWTPEEEQQLRDGFAAHKPIPELATAHGRTPGAITSRLAKLGLIQTPAPPREPPSPPITDHRPPITHTHTSAAAGPPANGSPSLPTISRRSLGEGGSPLPPANRPHPILPPKLSQEQIDALPF